MNLRSEFIERNRVHDAVDIGTPIKEKIPPGEIWTDKKFEVAGTSVTAITLPLNVPFVLIRINDRHGTQFPLFAGRTIDGLFIQKLFVTIPAFSNVDGADIHLDVAIVDTGGGYKGGAPNQYPPNGGFNRRPDSGIVVPTNTVYASDTKDFQVGTTFATTQDNIMGVLSSPNKHVYAHRFEINFYIELNPIATGTPIQVSWIARETITLDVLQTFAAIRLRRSPVLTTDGKYFKFTYEPPSPSEWFKPNSVELVQVIVAPANSNGTFETRVTGELSVSNALILP